MIQYTTIFYQFTEAIVVPYKCSVDELAGEFPYNVIYDDSIAAVHMIHNDYELVFYYTREKNCYTLSDWKICDSNYDSYSEGTECQYPSGYCGEGSE